MPLHGSSVCEYNEQKQKQVLALLRFKFTSSEHFKSIFTDCTQTKTFVDQNNDVPFSKETDGNDLLAELVPDFKLAR
jgi:hypothetical protein